MHTEFQTWHTVRMKIETDGDRCGGRRRSRRRSDTGTVRRRSDTWRSADTDANRCLLCTHLHLHTHAHARTHRLHQHVHCQLPHAPPLHHSSCLSVCLIVARSVETWRLSVDTIVTKISKISRRNSKRLLRKQQIILGDYFFAAPGIQ